jgi:hypothetical protein
MLRTICVEPKEPYLDPKPKSPEEYIEVLCEVYLPPKETVNFQQLLLLLPPGIDVDDLRFKLCDDWETCLPEIFYIKREKNTTYKSELKRYNKYIKQYEIKKQKYEEELKQYKIDLKDYISWAKKDGQDMTRLNKLKKKYLSQ